MLRRHFLQGFTARGRTTEPRTTTPRRAPPRATMDAKGPPVAEEFVEVSQQAHHVDPLQTYLANAGVVEPSKLGACLRSCNLDESSLAQLDDEDLREVLGDCKAHGISVGDRAKLKALVKRTTSNHSYFTVPPQPSAPPPSYGAPPSSPVPPPVAAAGGPAPPPPLANRFVRTFDRLSAQALPLRQSAADFIDRCQTDYISPAIDGKSWWPRVLVLFVMAKAFDGLSSRRRSGSALACLLVGYFMRPRTVTTEAAAPAEAPSPAPAPPQ